MSIIATAVKHLIAAGVTGDDLVRAIADMEAQRIELMPADSAAEKRREWDRNRKRQQRISTLSGGNKVESGGHENLSSPEGSSPTPPSPKPLQSIPPSPPKGGSSPAEFGQLWSIYPHKVGKPVAEKAFSKALKRASFENILTGLRRYVAKTDDRPWCNLSTWLNQDRWDDAPALPLPRQHSQAPPKPQSDFHRRQDEIYRNLRRQNGEPDDQFTGPTLDLAERDFRPH